MQNFHTCCACRISETCTPAVTMVQCLQHTWRKRNGSLYTQDNKMRRSVDLVLNSHRSTTSQSWQQLMTLVTAQHCRQPRVLARLCCCQCTYRAQAHCGNSAAVASMLLALTCMSWLGLRHMMKQMPCDQYEACKSTVECRPDC